MKKLALYNTESVDKLVWPPENTSITMRSNALSIFTDFKQFMPLVIDSTAKAVELEDLMKKSHVRMKLVLDSEKNFIGVIALSDLTEQKILAKVTKNQPREEITVTDFMRPRNTLKAFAYEELSTARVGDVVETLRDNHQQHCLVIDKSNHEIRGLISASDVARLLKLPVDIQLQPSFVDLFNVAAA
ncbi:CBS domain-containing protein [Aliiglaciecola sp. 2_MG-2023]|uniref:CBS domain-containing protein n=1 Tax=Alteromonadaceae TaxID=72275 RepID=UPI0026E40F22|nr:MULTISPECIES: CBS domain-containing protein [unclassified Aliiglaciecola]MDO6709538.1 CBS domain-containing protein [Aliiglaciecola sp. 2_MG-2023]MDO6750920.1 CBS domain-containing protein [Aliiglaciecola sp. 1_MG-2023]